MAFRSSPLSAAGVVAVGVLVLAAWLDRAAPVPSADVARGSEDAFARGLHPRELPPHQPPQRWTTERALFRFRNLPRGPLVVDVAVHGQRGPVAVAASGVVLGVVEPPTPSARFALSDSDGGALEIELRPQAFAAGGRRLGVLLDHVTVEPPATGALPTAGVLASVLFPALLLVALASAVGVAPLAAALLALSVAALQCLALFPCGLLRSDYAVELAVLLCAGTALAWAIARWLERRSPAAGRWAFLALLAALLVQGIAATSPLMVVSDAVFHAHNLEAVSRGNLFLTSRTQHATPFQIPYGVSFYALLAPLHRAGLDPVTLVRAGAAASGVLASGALLLLLLPTGAPRAALAVLILQILPGTFDIFSFGNLSNVFAQALTVAFFAWWAGTAPGGWPVGAALLATGCIGHLSGLVVLTVLAGILAWVRRRELDQARSLALAVGLFLAALYYLQFWGLIADQLPRLLEGGGQGRGASRGAAGALLLQLMGAVGQWGPPAMLLALLGRPQPARSGLDRDLAGFWLAGLLLAIPAVVSPLDVRYLYALTLPLSVAAAHGFETLSPWSGWGRASAWVLLALQAVLAARGIVEAILYRYRAG